MSSKRKSDTTSASKPKDSQTPTQSTEIQPSTFREASRLAGTERTPSIHGVATDPTPDDHYTVAGVTAGKPTPETDVDHANRTRETLADTGEKLPVKAHKSLQHAADVEAEQGFRGHGVDQEPNSTYTVAGVLKTQPPIETNEDATKRAHEKA